MVVNVDLNFIAGSLIVGTISAFIFHLLAVRRANTEARRNAAIKFHSEFRRILSEGSFYPLDSIDWEAVNVEKLTEMWPELQLAVDDFRPFIKKKHDKILWNSWQTFIYGTKYKNGGVPQFIHYSLDGNPPEYSMADETFARNLNQLLECATRYF